MVEDLAVKIFCLDGNFGALLRSGDLLTACIGLAVFQRDGLQCLISCSQHDHAVGHDKGGLFRILVSHSNIAVVHFPTVEHIARAALSRDLNSIADDSFFNIGSAVVHGDGMQIVVYGLQGHFPFGHRKLKGLALQLLLRQAVHTGHFPVAELLACRGRVCRCNDGVALFDFRCGVAIDGKGAAFNGKFLVNGLHLHVRVLHGNSRSRVLFVVQHAHRAFGSGAQLHQRIGALSQRRSGKGEHHASGQRRRYCTPDKFALFHGTTSFSPPRIFTGGYVLQYLDYFTLYRILEANLRESP